MTNIKLKPSDLNNAQLMLQHEAHVDESLLLNSDNPDIYVVKAVCCMHRGDFTEALKYCKQALGFDPTFSGVYVTLGTIYGNLGMFEEAGKAFETGYQLAQDVPSLNWNLALHLLQKGDFFNGWELYKWRKVHLHGHMRTLMPEFDGYDGKGKRLLIWAEQGLGDVIMMLRFVDRVKEQFGFSEIYFEVPDELYNLIVNNVSNVDYVYVRRSDGHCPFVYDTHISLMEMPWLFAVQSKEQFGKEPYITTHPLLTEEWAKHINDGVENKDGLKIGVCWRGSASHQNDHNRSASVNDLLPLKGTGTLFGIMKECNEEVPKELNMFNVAAGLISAEHTAAFIDNLDVVITIDSFVAHLAGAMGKKVYLLLPFVREWRWGTNDEVESYMYKDVTYFPQEKPGDWSKPIERIKQCLKQLGQQLPT